VPVFRSGRVITRREGFLFFGAYLVYTLALVLSA